MQKKRNTQQATAQQQDNKTTTQHLNALSAQPPANPSGCLSLFASAAIFVLQPLSSLSAAGFILLFI